MARIVPHRYLFDPRQEISKSDLMGKQVFPKTPSRSNPCLYTKEKTTVNDDCFFLVPGQGFEPF